jgi:type II restriction enzyme
MNLKIDISIEERFKSRSQKARLLTEKWAYGNVLCPSCGGGLKKYPNNRPVADFECRSCAEDFELKSTSSKIGRSIPDGAYKTMMTRLSSKTNPSLFVLQYDSLNWFVTNLLVIPKFYFTPEIIQKRTPLSTGARRAGWIGCNILLGAVPIAGRIPLVVDRMVRSTSEVVTTWNKTKFLREFSDVQSKNWLLKTMSCIDKLAKKRFELKEIYAFESQLRSEFPRNRHIKEKLRQQLQVLRDRGYVSFLGAGRYELNSTTQEQIRFLAD